MLGQCTDRHSVPTPAAVEHRDPRYPDAPELLLYTPRPWRSSDLFRRKSLADAVADSEQSQTGLKRTLSAVDLTMLGIGAIIGAGLFSSIGDMTAGDFAPMGRRTRARARRSCSPTC